MKHRYISSSLRCLQTRPDPSLESSCAVSHHNHYVEIHWAKSALYSCIVKVYVVDPMAVYHVSVLSSYQSPKGRRMLGGVHQGRRQRSMRRVQSRFPRGKRYVYNWLWLRCFRLYQIQGLTRRVCVRVCVIAVACFVIAANYPGLEVIRCNASSLTGE